MQKYCETFMVGKPELSWKTMKVEVARSGDLAYSWSAGSVWRKQPGGGWKIALDTMIPDPPSKPATKRAD